MGLFNLYGCFVQKQQTLEQTQKRKKWTSFLKDKSKKQKKTKKKQKISKRENDNERYTEHALLSVRGEERETSFL